MEVIFDGIVYVPKEKSELDLLKEKYESGEYICIFKYLSSEKNVWAEQQTPKFNDYTKKYKLIHKKHESILEAYLDGKNIEVEDTRGYVTVNSFVDTYSEHNKYRIKETKSNCEVQNPNMPLSFSDLGVSAITIDEEPKGNKYTRKIIGHKGGVAYVDVYDVLQAFKVENPALQHLIKKALCVGIRWHKDSSTDLQDIIDSAVRAKELEK